MKKLVPILVACMLVLVIFSGCSQGATSASSQAAASTQAAASESAAPASSAVASAAQTEAASPVAVGSGDPSLKKTKLYVGVSIRDLSNPYQVTEIDGAKMFVSYLQSIGQDCELQTMVCNSSDDKQLSDIKAFIAKSGGNAILYMDPNDAAITPTVADACEQAHVYLVTVWSKPDDASPMDYQYWIAHHTPKDTKSGYDIATEMFKTFKTPGTGKILAVQGMLGNNSASDRFAGLQQALKENPNVQLLGQQAADWDTTKAMNIVETWLSKYPDVDGIWCANDSMAVGALQALKNAKLNGKVKLVGIDGIDDAVTAIKNGDMVATVSSNGWLQAGYSLSIDYAAWTGAIKVSDLPQNQRLFNTKGLLITQSTVAQYIHDYIDNKPQYDFSKPFDMIYTEN